VKYPHPCKLRFEDLQSQEALAIQIASEELVAWTHATLRILGDVGVADKGPIITELLVYGAAAGVIGYDDANKLDVDANGFASFAADCFAAALRELEEKRRPL